MRVETKVNSEWSSHLWKIQLDLNTTVQKATGTTQLRARIGIDVARPLIQSHIKNICTNLKPKRNTERDRTRVGDSPKASSESFP